MDRHIRLLAMFAETHLPIHVIHSGTPSGGVICTNVTCWYEWDEDGCEQDWSNYLDLQDVREEYSVEDLLPYI